MMKPNPIRVIVVNDSRTIGNELAGFLETNQDFELVAQARNSVQAIRLCNELRPDVVLMDMVMPDTDGAAMMEAIGEAHPDIQIIAMTNFQDEALVRAALQVGSIGHLLKSVSMMETALAS